MALKQHRKYLVLFKLPDGEHVAVHDNIAIESKEDAQSVTQHVMHSLSQNPDAELIDVMPLKNQAHLDEHVARIKETNAGPTADVLVEQGVIDVTNRILTNPEIPRGLATLYTPGA